MTTTRAHLLYIRRAVCVTAMTFFRWILCRFMRHNGRLENMRAKRVSRFAQYMILLLPHLLSEKVSARIMTGLREKQYLYMQSDSDPLHPSFLPQHTRT